MFISPLISGYYFGLKAVFFYGLVHSFVKFDPLQKHCIFLSLLYAAGIAFLSYVFLIAPGVSNYWGSRQLWAIWLGETAVIAFIYFKLLARFDEGILFWLLLIGGVGVVLF
ncbi:MAG: hypothetical protein ACLQIB_46050 [Isosphaeraceae bacterium]